MALPDIILTKPNILVTKGFGSIAGLESNTSDFEFGSIEMVYDTCDSASVGDNVLFPIKEARQILYGSTMYYIINEAFLVFREIPL